MARTIRTLFEFQTKAQTGGVMAVRRELEGLDDSVDDFGRQALDASGKADKAEQSIGALGRAASAAKKTLAGLSAAGIGGITAAVGLVSRDVITAADDMSMFQAQTGLSTEALGEYEEIARRLHDAGLGDSFGDVAGVLQQVRATTNLQGSDLQLMTEQALRFQQVFGVDTPESIRAVNTLMSTFGINAGRAWDMVIAAQQNGAGYAGDFADSIAEYAANYEALGFDVQQFMSMNAQAAELGLRNTDVLNDTMREFGIRLNDNTSAQALFNLGLGQQLQAYRRGEIDGRQMFMAVQDGLNAVENDARRMELGAQIFGTKWEDETAQAILDLDLITADMMDVEGASEAMAKAMESGPTMAFRMFTRAIQGSLRDAIGPYVTKVLGAAIPAINRLTEKSPQLVAFAAALAGIAATFLPLMAVIGAAAPAFTMLGSAAAVAAGPLLLLGGAVAAFGLAYKNNFLGIQDKIKELPDTIQRLTGIDLSGLKGKLQGALDELKADPAAFVGNLKTDIETSLSGIDLNLSGLKEDLESTLSGIEIDSDTFAGGIIEQLSGVELPEGEIDFTTIGTNVANRLLDVILIALPIIFGGPAGLAIGAAKAVATAFETDFLGFRTALEETGIVSAIEEGAGWVWDTLTGFFGGGDEGDQDTSALSGIINTITTTLQPLIDWLGELGGNIEPGLTAIKDGIVDFIDAFDGVETSGIEGALETILTIVGAVVGGLIASLKPLLEGATTALGEGLEAIGNFLGNLGGYLSGIITGISRLFEGDFSGAAESILGAITDLIGGIAGLAIDGLDATLEGITTFVDGIADLAGLDLSGITSSIAGIPEAISQGAGDIGGAVKTWITDKFKDAVKKIAHYFTNGGFDTLGGKLNKMITGLPEWLSELPSNIKTSITDKFSEAVGAVWEWLAGDGEGSLKTKLLSLPAAIENALLGVGDAIKSKLVDPALEKLAPLIDVFDTLLKGIGKIGDWLGVGGSGGGDGEWYQDPQDVYGQVQGAPADDGGAGRRGVPRFIGSRAQPEMFIPETNGTFVPRKHWSIVPTEALAGAGAGGGPVTVHQWGGATLHFEGVKDIDDLYRQITELERRKNIKARRA